MNASEGARRMRTAGRWIVLAAFCACALLLGLMAALTALRSGFLVPGFEIADMLLLLLLACVPGALLWVAGWIVEGFTKTAS